jgi:hypothetical protein
MVSIDRTKTGKYPNTEPFRAWTDLMAQEAAQALGSLSGDTSTAVVISGCKLYKGATYWQVSAGTVAYNGNIYVVAAYVSSIAISAAYATAAAALYFHFTISVKTISQASGGINMQDGTNPDVVSYGTGTIVNYNADVVFNAARYAHGEATWHIVGGSNEPALGGNLGDATNALVRFKKGANNKVELGGGLQPTGSGGLTNSTVLWTMPAGYFNVTRSIYIPVTWSKADGSSNGAGYLVMNANDGDLFYIGSTVPQYANIALDGLGYYLD